MPSPKKIETRQFWKSFSINMGLVMLLFITVLYTGIFLNNRESIEGELENRGRAIFVSIVLAREWNAHYGGIYVEKLPGIESNPYLVNPDIETLDGRHFTKKNPALMTREMSELAEQEGSFRFHITSLKPINPQNSPDDFERLALESFNQSDIKEMFRFETYDERPWFRYIAPLRVTNACVECHKDQGYLPGDLRGGISVSFDVGSATKALDRNLWLTIALGVMTLLLLLGIVYQLVFALFKRLRRAEQRLQELATTDELTGLANRRYILQRLEDENERIKRHGGQLTAILFDVDNFKTVNDTYGHAAGDDVLKGIAAIAHDCFRISDVVARYGGEEFLVIMPSTVVEQGVSAAEKLRVRIKALEVMSASNEPIRITISLGVSQWCSGSPSVEALISRADQALYEAKKEGRDCTRVLASSDA